MIGSDESYVIDICDRILNRRAIRQHRFDFLRGDPGKNGGCAMLPVDAYLRPAAVGSTIPLAINAELLRYVFRFDQEAEKERAE